MSGYSKLIPKNPSIETNQVKYWKRMRKFNRNKFDKVSIKAYNLSHVYSFARCR